MDKSFFTMLIGGKNRRKPSRSTSTTGVSNEVKSQAVSEPATGIVADSIHGWVAAGRDPRAVMTGGLLGASTLFR